MLVLNRKQNEGIHIGDNVVLRVLGIRGSNVRLGIDAPKSIAIRRSELPVLVPERPPPAVPPTEELPYEFLADGVGQRRWRLQLRHTSLNS